MPKIYIGDPKANPRERVTVNGYPLDPRFDLRYHSPDGFAWGYCGSGPAQLALALLADATGDDEIAQRYYQDFKEEVIAKIEPDANFEMTDTEILEILEKIKERNDPVRRRAL
jgi:hypothetical protein